MASYRVEEEDEMKELEEEDQQKSIRILIQITIRTSVPKVVLVARDMVGTMMEHLCLKIIK